MWCWVGTFCVLIGVFGKQHHVSEEMVLRLCEHQEELLWVGRSFGAWM